MNNTIDTIREFTYGNTRLTVRTVYDDSADYSYLGDFSDSPADTFAYHRPSGLMLISGEYWRDERGRIASDPREERWGWDSRYGDDWINPCVWDGESLRLTFQSAKRLDRLARGDWYYIGVLATVQVNDREIGHASLWGIESDSAAAYIAEVARECTREALDDARAFRETLSKVAS